MFDHVNLVKQFQSQFAITPDHLLKGNGNRKVFKMAATFGIA
jgi:hypothetical protein